jgi:hypothetical protein
VLGDGTTRMMSATAARRGSVKKFVMRKGLERRAGGTYGLEGKL